MINFKKEKNMYELFIDKKIITTQELLSLGFTNKDLTRLIEGGKIRRVQRGQYELANANNLFRCAQILASEKQYDKFHKAMERAVEVDPDFVIARFYMFLTDIKTNDYHKAFECYQELEKCPGFYDSDKNLWLYLMSFIMDLPQEYQERVSNFKKEDVLLPITSSSCTTDIFHNKVRNLMMQQRFREACTLLFNCSDYNNRRVKTLIEATLTNQVRKKERDYKGKWYELVENGKYEELYDKLETLEKLHGLSSDNKMVKNMIADLILMTDERDIPEVVQGGYSERLAAAIERHDYELAEKLFHYDESCIESKLLKLLFDKINFERKSIEEEERCKQQADLFESIKSNLTGGEMQVAIDQLDTYLGNIGALKYKDLLLEFIKLALIKKDEKFLETIFEIQEITKGNFDLSPSWFVMDFYLSVMKGNLEKAAVYYNIISKANELTEDPIDITAIAKKLDSELEKAGKSLDDVAIQIPGYKEKEVVSEAIEKIPTIVDIVERVLEKDNLCLLEPVSSEEASIIMNVVSRVPNISTTVFEDYNGDLRVALRNVDRRGEYIDMRDYLQRANYNYRNGNYDDAIELYQTVLPKMQEPKSFVYLYLGLSYYKANQAGDWERAIDYLTMATMQAKNNNEYCDCSVLLGRLKAKTGYNGIRVQSGDTGAELAPKMYSKKDN